MRRTFFCHGTKSLHHLSVKTPYTPSSRIPKKGGYYHDIKKKNDAAAIHTLPRSHSLHISPGNSKGEYNMRSFTTFDIQDAHRFYKFQGEAQYLHGHTGRLTLEVEDSINPGVNMVFPCNEIKKIAWNVIKNFDHALILREDDPLLPAILAVYEKQGIRNGSYTNTMKGEAFHTELAQAHPDCRVVVTKESMT